MNTITLEHIEIHRVSSELFRGGRIESILAMNELAKFGIKTVICLENDKMQVLSEEMWCHDLGIRFVHIPMGEFERPMLTTLNKILNYVDKLTKPIYLHCKHGQDRTGYAVINYRVKKQGWSITDAWNECLQYGHKWLWYFYWKKTLKEIIG